MIIEGLISALIMDVIIYLVLNFGVNSTLFDAVKNNSSLIIQICLYILPILIIIYEMVIMGEIVIRTNKKK